MLLVATTDASEKLWVDVLFVLCSHNINKFYQNLKQM